jgi:hypothetical protein
LRLGKTEGLKLVSSSLVTSDVVEKYEVSSISSLLIFTEAVMKA